jgi:hypothetical protein
LQTLYPEYEIIKPTGYWKDRKNQRAFFDQLAVKLNIQRPEDWNHVTFTTVFNEGGHFIGRYYNNSVKQGTDVVILELTSRSVTSSLS